MQSQQNREPGVKSMLRGALVSRSVAEWIETHIVISLLLLVATALSACAGSGSAEVTATLAPTPTAHSDSPDTPPHTHAKDGLMVFTDNLPAPALVPNTIDRNELFDQLSADKPIVVGVVDDSGQTVVLTIPTMF
jgi:hypothetical protein